MKTSELGSIAIVDDDDSARDALKFLLTVLGRRPKCFASAREFLEEATDAFSRLILDQNMPGMTGLELAEHLRSKQNDIPIMLISGGLTQDVIDKAAQLRVSLVLQKPADLRVLESFIGG